MNNWEHIIQRYLPKVKEKYPDTIKYLETNYFREMDEWNKEYDRIGAKIKKYTDTMFKLWCNSEYSDIPFEVIYKWEKCRDKAEKIIWSYIYLPYSKEINMYRCTTDPIVLIMEKWSNGVFPPFDETYMIDNNKITSRYKKYYRCIALVWYLKSKLKLLEEIVDRNKNNLDKLIKLTNVVIHKKNIEKDFREEKV